MARDIMAELQDWRDNRQKEKDELEEITRLPIPAEDKNALIDATTAKSSQEMVQANARQKAEAERQQLMGEYEAINKLPVSNDKKKLLFAIKANKRATQNPQTASLQRQILVPQTSPGMPQQSSPGLGEWGAIQKRLQGGFQQDVKALNEAQERQEKAAEASYAAGQERAAAEAGYRDELAQLQEQRAGEMAEKLAQRQKLMNDEMKKLEGLRSEVDNFEETDPSVGQRIGMAIAGALAGFAGGRAGDPAAGVRVVNQMIQRQVEEDKRRLEQKKGAVAGKENMLARMRQNWADEDSAEHATYLAYMEMAENKVNSLLVKAKAPEMQAKLEEVKAQLQADKAARVADLRQKTGAQIIAAQAQADADSRARGVRSDLRVPGMKLSGEKTPTKEDVKKMNDARAKTKTALDKADQLIHHLNEYGTEWTSWVPGWESTASKIGVSLARDLQLLAKELYKLGVLTGPDMELIEGLIESDPNAPIFSSDVIAKLNVLKNTFLRDFHNTARQHGYQEMELPYPSQQGGAGQRLKVR